MKYNRVGFIFNSAKQYNDEVILHLAGIAKRRGLECAAFSGQTRHINLPFSDLESTDVDFAVVLGGDGSVLLASDFASERNIPLLAVNNGRVGFLTAIETDDFDYALGRILCGAFTIEKKMMLSCVLREKTLTSLNDFIIYKSNIMNVAQLSISIDSVDAGSLFCDGIVVCTPTGATAYSISAGGPVVAPGLDVITVTPICPHSLCFRPIVAKSDSVIEIKALSDCLLARAGDVPINIKSGERLTVRRSGRTSDFFVFQKNNIYSLIREKLS